MKSTRFFFIEIILISLTFIATLSLPNSAHATPKTLATGEYPEAVGARCADVKYASKSTDTTAGTTAFVTSPNQDGPTMVHVGLYVDEITEVDEGANTYGMQGLLDMIWCDPRLSFDPSQTGTKVEIFLEDDAHGELNNIWWPNLKFVNQEQPSSIENLTLLIHPDGTVEYRSNFDAVLAADFNLHAFPFDNQDLKLKLQSFDWAGDTLTFLKQDGVIGFSQEFRIPEWYVTDIKEEIGSKKEIRDQNEFSEFVATIHVKRDPGVYVTKVMFPLGIIILITMVIFWMEAGSFEDRLGASMTGLLTAVAYQFIASQNLPKHVYNTYLDSFVFLSFLIIIFGIGESALVKWQVANNKEEQAQRTDQIARWFMPALYIVMIVALYFIYTA